MMLHNQVPLIHKPFSGKKITKMEVWICLAYFEMIASGAPLQLSLGKELAGNKNTLHTH
uniref:Uncharacterized protein n=1 Tax=Anguilla anguilla TaxID=7936 RepID=A0A0E9SCW8_ANGAN